MIIDTIDNLGKYVALNPLFADVVEYLKNNDLQTMEVGKYPIKDKDLFLNLSLAKQRTKDTAFLETHINMIDIQIPITCAETFGYTPLEDLPDFEYNAENESWTDGYFLPTGRSCPLYHRKGGNQKSDIQSKSIS